MKKYNLIISIIIAVLIVGCVVHNTKTRNKTVIINTKIEKSININKK